MATADGYDHVPFVQGMTLNPRTIAHGSFIVPNAYWDHPIPRWMNEHPGEGYPSRWRIHQIMRAAKKVGWDPQPYEDACRQVRQGP